MQKSKLRGSIFEVNLKIFFTLYVLKCAAQKADAQVHHFLSAYFSADMQPRKSLEGISVWLNKKDILLGMVDMLHRKSKTKATLISA